MSAMQLQKVSKEVEELGLGKAVAVWFLGVSSGGFGGWGQG